MRKLLSGLTDQLAIYEKLLERTNAGKTAFESRDDELFMSILTERLDIMNEIDRLEGEIKPLREKWILSHEEFSDIFNKKIIELVKNMQNIMGEIMSIENSLMDEKNKENQEVKAVPKGRAIGRYKNS